MGQVAQVIGIGPYSGDVSSALEYSADRYAAVSIGTTVVTNVFVASTTSESVALAAAFGFEIFDLGRHHIALAAADHEKIRNLFGDEELKNFLILTKAGFQFYFLPNG